MRRLTWLVILIFALPALGDGPALKGLRQRYQRYFANWSAVSDDAVAEVKREVAGLLKRTGLREWEAASIRMTPAANETIKVILTTTTPPLQMLILPDGSYTIRPEPARTVVK